MRKNILILFFALFLFINAFSKPFTFVVMGDNRPTFKEQPYVYYKIVKKLKKLNPDFIISTGDIIEGYTKNEKELLRMYDDYISVTKPILNKLYFVAGNHDVMRLKKLYDDYMKKFGKFYYSFDKENAHFIILNSEEWKHSGEIVGAQWEWLKNDLKKNKKKHIFVFLHRPIYAKIGHIGSSMDKYPKKRDKLATLLKKYNVDMIFTGHTHIYNFSVINGLPQTITGGAGAPLYADKDNGGFYHFIKVIVNGDDVEYRVVPVDSEIEIARKLRLAKKFDAADFFLEQAEKNAPAHPEIFVEKCLVAFTKKNTSDFNLFFKKLNKLYNDKSETYVRLALSTYYFDENYENALYFLKKANEIKSSGRNFYYMGKVAFEMKKYQDALRYFESMKKYDKKYEKYANRMIKKVKEAMKK